MSDNTDSTDWKIALELIYAESPEKRDIYGKNNIFQVVALTNGFTLTPAMARGLDSAFRAGDNDKGDTRHIRMYFIGRILGPQSPHMFLPFPYDPAISENEKCHLNAISLHTTFLTADDFVFDSKEPISKGDIFNVVLFPGTGDDPFNLQVGMALSRNKEETHASIKGISESIQNMSYDTTFSPPAAPELPVTPGDECKPLTTGDVAYPCLTNTSVRLVVFYHGVESHGNQAVVLGKLKEIGIADNVMFLIPKGRDKNYADVEQSIEELVKLNGLTITDKYLGAWSGGSVGFKTAFYYGTRPWPGEFSETMLADPSPFQWTEGVTYMEYRPENWTGPNAELGQQQIPMAEQIENAGGKAVHVALGHEEILVQILKRLAA
jgi:hypothetical protein